MFKIFHVSMITRLRSNWTAYDGTTDLNLIAPYYQSPRFFTWPMEKISTGADVGIINVKNLFLHFRTYVLVCMYLLRYRKVNTIFGFSKFGH